MEYDIEKDLKSSTYCNALRNPKAISVFVYPTVRIERKDCVTLKIQAARTKTGSICLKAAMGTH